MTYALTTNRADFRADLCELARFFWGDVAIGDEGDAEADVRVDVRMREEGGVRHVRAAIRAGEREAAIEREEACAVDITNDDPADNDPADNDPADAPPSLPTPDALARKRERKYALKIALYDLLSSFYDRSLPWGALTGVRPSRLFRDHLAVAATPAEAMDAMRERYRISPPKLALLRDIAAIQAPYMDVPRDECDIYIGIPFCTTRCSYCSFVSIDATNGARYHDAYVDALLAEMEATARDMRDIGMRPRALYVGGGTPTALPAQHLARVLECAARLFGAAREFTVEAGRPDTIDAEKLDILWQYGARRVSVNPQTMNDATLARIGRNHTARDAIAAYELARARGFAVNMDLIIGLPGEVAADFAHTLRAIEPLRPENLTVHALSLKRTSALRQGAHRAEEAEAEAMSALAAEAARAWGLAPYYLYRQKYMAANLENVGYTAPNRECIYNIDIMEETANVLAFGAGAMSKRVRDAARRIDRAANVKNVEAYIARVPEMVARKRALLAL